MDDPITTTTTFRSKETLFVATRESLEGMGLAPGLVDLLQATTSRGQV